MLGLKSLPFFEVAVFVIHSFGALGGILFTRLVRNDHKKVHVKKYCICDENGKRGRII